MAQLFEIFFVVFDASLQVFAQDCDLDVASFVRGDAGFSTHISDGFDGVHDAFELFCFYREAECVICLRPSGSCQGLAFVRQVLPEVFGDEWHEWVQQRQHAGQGVNQHILGHLAVGIVLAIETGLRGFDVPVAEIVPSEVINAVSSFAQFVFIQVCAYVVFGVSQAVQDPLVSQGELVFGGYEIFVVVIQVHEGELGRVPQLVGEVSISFYSFIIETHIVARGIAGHQSEAQGIGAVFLDDFQWIDAVAQRFGHLAALGVSDQAMDEYVFEWDFIHEFHGHEHHASDPEENDVVAGYQSGCRVPLLQGLGLIRPAHGREWPQSRGEPGIEHVRILVNVLAMAVRTFGEVRAGSAGFAAVVAVPYRDAVAPPELTGNTPIMDVGQPLHIGLGETFRYELGLAGDDSVHSRACQRFHLHEPLLGGHRFYDGLAARAMAHSMLGFFDLHQEAGSFEISDDGFSGFITIHAAVFAGFFIHRAIFIHDDDGRQVMSLAHFKVVRVMGRGDLHAAGAVCHVYIFIGNDRDLAAGARESDHLAHQIFVSFIFRIHCYRRIAGDGFRTGGSDLDVSALFAYDGIVEIPKMAYFILMLYFDVGKSSLAAGAPIGDAESLVNQSLFIEGNENFSDRARADVIHGETFTLPVAGGAQTADLQADAVAVFLLPLPYAIQEFLAAQVVLVQTFFGDFFFYLDLGSNAGVVFAWEPQHIEALHSLVTDQDILQGIVQCVAHVQLACDIRRREDDAVRFLFGIRFIMEYAMFFPEIVPSLFDRTGIIFAKVFHICHMFHS